MAHIHKTTLINAPVDKVYAFARDPERWSDWWVGLRPADNITGKGETGTVVKHQYKMAGMFFPVTTRVISDTASPKQAVAKLEFEGPIAGNQEWKYEAKGDATEVTVDIDYAVPGKALGKLADRLVIERMEEKSIEHTIDNLKMLVEAGVHAPAHA